MDTITELITRLRTENPPFFKKLQYAAVIVGAISGFLGFIVSHGIAMPSWLQDASKYLATACASVAFTSILPNKDINK